SHLGWKIGDPAASDECVIKETAGIDLVLGGHSHTMLATPQYVEDAAGKKVPVIQNGKSACSISRFDIHVK
ncbi:MAG: bifunctional metallophosphatase/5'-nucleotidase, partial [Prevotella sp.]|nr:bifunctional metallophosphatase/5'-nucleotidase [Prevotella sp.]